MSRQERRYRTSKVVRKRWIRYHDREPSGFWARFLAPGEVYQRYYPEPGIYRKYNGSHGRCACGTWRKVVKQMTNRNLRNYDGPVQNGGWYKRFEDPWNWD